jgi:hypothetical protein
MLQPTKDAHNDLIPACNKESDSPTVQHLIEQLDRDLEETLRKQSNGH